MSINEDFRHHHHRHRQSTKCLDVECGDIVKESDLELDWELEFGLDGMVGLDRKCQNVYVEICPGFSGHGRTVMFFHRGSIFSGYYSLARFHWI